MVSASPPLLGGRVGSRPAACLLVVLACASLPPLSGRASAQLSPPEVTDVRFEGNQTFSSDSLATAIVTRETECRSGFFNFPIPLCPLGIGFALNRAVLRERDLPRDQARLILWYRQRGFRDVQVDAPTVSRRNGTVQVLFRVTEGRPVVADSIVYTGGEGVERDVVLANLPIREGDRLSTIALDATRDSIVHRLADRGYAYAEVYRTALRPSDDPYNAVVTFDIVPGPRSTYGDVTIEGIENLSVGTVLRTAQIRRGDLYRRSAITDATTRLYGLQIIRSASVVPDTLSLERDSIIDVAITVREGDPYRVRAGGGLNTAECFNVEARWTSRNFFGGGRLLQVRGRVGNILASSDWTRDNLCRQAGSGDFADPTGVASVEFVQPWIFSTRNSLSTSVYAERQALPNVFIRTAVGAQIALSRTVAPQTVLTAFMRPEVSEFDQAADVLFCTGFLVCDPDDVSEITGTNFLSPVGFSLTRDRSNDILNPRSGYRVLLDVEHAARWTRSDFRYDRILFEASSYTPVGPTVLAGRVRGGWVGSGGFQDFSGATEESLDVVPPQKRFYTGGANSVRGFAQSGLGPRILFASPTVLTSTADRGGGCSVQAVVDLSCVPASGTALEVRPTGGTRVVEANAEFRFPVASYFEGVLFGDVGQAWNRDQTVSFDDLEFSPGVGVRIPSPVGPIRVDLAYRFRGAENLAVVTEQIEVIDQNTMEWIGTGGLVRLDQPVLFGVNDRGLQLHVSIGQAF